MQGTHIFRRDRTIQLIKHTPCSTRLYLHPTIIQKMKTVLEVENKMGPIPMPGSQFRPPLPDTNPNIRKSNVTEKGKRATPKKKFTPANPKPAAACPPLLEAPPKPSPSVPGRKSTPWPGAGKMSGNLLTIEIGWSLKIIYPVRTKRRMQQALLVKTPHKRKWTQDKWTIFRKMQMGPDCPVCKSQKEGREEDKTQQELKASPQPKLQRSQARQPRTLNLNKTSTKQQWEEEIERLNEKNNLDFFQVQD